MTRVPREVKRRAVVALYAASAAYATILCRGPVEIGVAAAWAVATAAPGLIPEERKRRRTRGGVRRRPAGGLGGQCQEAANFVSRTVCSSVFAAQCLVHERRPTTTARADCPLSAFHRSAAACALSAASGPSYSVELAGPPL